MHHSQQMDVIKISFFFVVFLIFIPYPIRGAETCPIYQWCTKDEPTVRFPFTLKGRGSEVCGSPGYELTCNEMNKTVLELPFSGKFFVRNVYSFTQKIEIYDPDNCLPKRILKLNLSGTPYELGASYRKYSFLNCSSSIDSLLNITKLVHISCLSSSTHTVIATNVSIANIAPFNTSCLLIADVSVPISPTEDDGSLDLNESFFLSWPWLQLPPYLTRPPKRGKRRTILLSTLLSIFIGLPLLTICLCFCWPPIINWYKCLRARRARRRATSYASPGPVHPLPAVIPRPPPIVRTGLSDSTIQSYPQVILGESGRLPNPNDTTCAICIADFEAKDALKSMPTCNHCFHASCLEQWLRVNATCPVCRKSPLH
ncbi:hypothetical protein C5167_047590 [Papaver somniferum]|uniref:RING-type E3 ubiquitin transferase n=1 Tax=Papaver somniferum TaxID=3469 RepID=A0A4Y7LK08_PAPSO|nr:RING-H2 finger protein ATL20-like [Papaver somniferum]RZC84808.1 hypothetical protein C5167_047590 [Papaver somniferum]